MAALEKITLHFKDGNTKELDWGFVAYEQQKNDLHADFLNVEAADIQSILNGLITALALAKKEADKCGSSKS